MSTYTTVALAGVCCLTSACGRNAQLQDFTKLSASMPRGSAWVRHHVAGTAAAQVHRDTSSQQPMPNFLSYVILTNAVLHRDFQETCTCNTARHGMVTCWRSTAIHGLPKPVAGKHTTFVPTHRLKIAILVGLYHPAGESPS